MIPKKVLFVCLGNICRSPTAEAVFRRKAQEAGLDLIFDSAGTSGNHIGERSDRRSIQHANLRGYEMTHAARQICEDDFRNYDLILVMDESNRENLRRMHSRLPQKNVDLITQHCGLAEVPSVPDPYYGGAAEFEGVLDIIEEAWTGFVQRYFPSVIP